jgi:2,4-dienoyl-CoA reductase-like NADH-dependent reductase (Old Yellow Enzyme family)
MSVLEHSALVAKTVRVLASKLCQRSGLLAGDRGKVIEGLVCTNIDTVAQVGVAVKHAFPHIQDAAVRSVLISEPVIPGLRIPTIHVGGFEPNTAEAVLEKGDADLVAFGRYFVSNPDLPKRIERKLPLSDYDRDTFFTFDARGYNDYPMYEESSNAA